MLPPDGGVWKLGKNWPQFAVLIQMFGRISALPTMPPRRLETWNFAWRVGGTEEAGQASEVWFLGRLGAAVPFPLGQTHGWFRGAAKEEGLGPGAALSENSKSCRLRIADISPHGQISHLPCMHHLCYTQSH